jgi:hypothetical protein
MLALVLLAALQQQPQPAPAKVPASVADTSPFRRLDLPAANMMREGSGMPGPKYWQQSVSYSIHASLDTAAQAIAGKETIRYTNHSPDSLRYLWFQVDQNIYKEGSRGSFINPEDARWSARGFEGGYTISDLVQVTPSGKTGTGTITSLSSTVNGTMLRVDLPHPLAPGATATLSLAYRFQIPEHGSDRMGRRHYLGGWTYELAQWFPRLVVYDDVNGWNVDQYLGQGEFYLEYGDIDFELTVPRSFIVAGSGTLLNPEQVLTADERTRLARARTADSTVVIVARADAGKASTRPVGASPTLTWRFSAKNVRDVAWATSPAFVWDASGWDGILMQSYYEPEANADWSNSTAYVRHTIQHYSEKWFHYPYPTAINIAGPVGGMEYPMIVFCGSGAGGRGLYGVTTHELGHQWFPMIVGSNERRYTWMDEGFNTFINIYSNSSFYHDTAYTGGQNNADTRAAIANAGIDQPIMIAPDRFPNPNVWGTEGYEKPGNGLFVLRQYVLDDTARFDAAFREYIRRWAFKHPTPADFFRSMNDGLGEDLSWFWRGWFFRTDFTDQAIDSVTAVSDSAGSKVTRVFLSSPGQMMMPVELRLTFADGATRMVKLPVEVWYFGNHYTYRLEGSGDLTKVEIDPNHHFPDIRRGNNVWQKQ